MENKINYNWDFFEDIYENTLRKGQTFSYEMGAIIQKELEKMYKQREEWLKNKKQKQKEVHFMPWVETKLMAVYSVEDASEPTVLYQYFADEGVEEYWTRGIDMFDKVEIDGTEVSVSSIDANNGTYQLGNGEHTIAYTLKDPTFIGVEYDEETGGIRRLGALFSVCTSLTSIDIPNSVTWIGNDVFQFCNGLKSITIPNSVTSISSGAFQYCSSLTSIVIPSGVTSIGNDAFQYCISLTSITVDTNNTVYDSRNNCNAIIEKSTNTLIQGCNNTIIPNGVTSIGEGAFAGCDGLITITIPNSVTSIGSNAFQNCTNLTDVTIGSGVTSIGSNAFNGCTSLTSITCNATTAPTIQFNTFTNVKTNGTLTVPIGSSGYDVWMGTGDYYLGKYSWTKVEQ